MGWTGEAKQAGVGLGIRRRILDRGSALGYYGNPFAHFIHSKTVGRGVHLGRVEGAREVVSQASRICLSPFLFPPFEYVNMLQVLVGDESYAIIVLWQLILLQDQLANSHSPM